MLEVLRSRRFKRDYKKILQNDRLIIKLNYVIFLLAHGKPLPSKNRDHQLTGNWAGYRECHVMPDWLLIYKTTTDSLYLARTGTHASLFD